MSALTKKIGLKSRTCLAGFGLCCLLSACSGINPKFGCDATAGVNCTPVARVNAEAEAGYFNHQLLASEVKTQPTAHTMQVSDKSQSRKATAEQGKRVARFRQFRVSDKPSMTRYAPVSSLMRSPERIQRIAIAPYEDSQHHYHQASEVLIILQASHWVNPALDKHRLHQTRVGGAS